MFDLCGSEEGGIFFDGGVLRLQVVLCSVSLATYGPGVLKGDLRRLVHLFEDFGVILVLLLSQFDMLSRLERMVASRLSRHSSLISE